MRQQSFLMRSNVEEMTLTSKTIFLHLLLHRTLSITRGLSETRSVSQMAVQVRNPGYCVSLSSPSFSPSPTLPDSFSFVPGFNVSAVSVPSLVHLHSSSLIYQSC